jgi:hypothetical protein
MAVRDVLEPITARRAHRDTDRFRAACGQSIHERRYAGGGHGDHAVAIDVAVIEQTAQASTHKRPTPAAGKQQQPDLLGGQRLVARQFPENFEIARRQTDRIGMRPSAVHFGFSTGRFRCGAKQRRERFVARGHERVEMAFGFGNRFG